MADAWWNLILALVGGGLIGGIISLIGMRQAQPKLEAEAASTWGDAAAALRSEMAKADKITLELRRERNAAITERDNCLKKLDALAAELQEQQQRRQRQVGDLNDRIDLLQHAQESDRYRIGVLEGALLAAGIDPATINGGTNGNPD